MEMLRLSSQGHLESKIGFPKPATKLMWLQHSRIESEKVRKTLSLVNDLKWAIGWKFKGERC
jgi:hypothetical protein